MEVRTVRDVLGDPESWPDYIRRENRGKLNMAGATISLVLASGNEIVVQTKGGACGETFSVFVIKDNDLRERTVRALRRGAPVHEAVAAAI